MITRMADERQRSSRSEAARVEVSTPGAVAAPPDAAPGSAWAAWLEGAWRDLRDSIRTVRRHPDVLVVSAISLGLGIGLNAMLYTGIATIFWNEPTMRDPDRVVGVEPATGNQFSYPDYVDLVERHVFEDAVAFRTAAVNIRTDGRDRRLTSLLVTSNFFDVLGVTARLGRTFGAIDAAREHDPVVAVLTGQFWRSFFHGDPSVVGRPLIVNGVPYTIVGVLPDDYRAVTGIYSPGLYLPVSRLTLGAFENRPTPSLTVLGRLRPNATATEARQAVTRLAADLERLYPERLTSDGRPAKVFAAATLQFRGTPTAFTLLATVGWITAALVLLIACVNVTGLLMARVTDRRRELAIRAALGAGRARVVRAIVAEAFLLVVIGAAVGLPLAAALARLPVPALEGVRQLMALDRRAVPYAAVVVGLGTVLCGLLPALKAMRSDVLSVMRDGGEASTPRMRLRQALVTAQVAMSFVLVVAAFLCVRSQAHMARVDLGFDLDHGIVANFGLRSNDYPGQQRVDLAERLVTTVLRIPGVVSASPADLVPLGGDVLIKTFHPAGRTDIPGTRPDTFSVGPAYFKTMAIPLLRGREFTAFDRADTRPVAIVNETFAKTYFPGRDVIGRVFETADESDATIVGLVRDHRVGTIGEPPRSVVYYAFAQRPSNLIVHVRTAIAPDGLVPSVRAAIDGIDATVPLNLEPLRSATRMEMNLRRAGLTLMGSIGALALVLAIIGLYGVMSYVAAARTPEIGIRMALGASASRIRVEMLRRALTVVAAGVAAGAFAAVAVTPIMTTMLAGVSPYDPVAFTAAALFLLLIGTVAGYVPAHRCAQVDPMRTLRRL